MKKAPWYGVLLAARRIGARGEELTSSALAVEAKIPDTALSTAVQIASGWLGKFYRWGYVLKIGRLRTKGRPATVWQLTKWGEECKLKKSAKPALKIAANPAPATRGKREE
jgi:hypothetical protein